jgi:hypothetical protein
MESVHKSWTSAGHGTGWTEKDGQPWSSSELGLATETERLQENDEGATGIRFWSSPKPER